MSWVAHSASQKAQGPNHIGPTRQLHYQRGPRACGIPPDLKTLWLDSPKYCHSHYSIRTNKLMCRLGTRRWDRSVWTGYDKPGALSGQGVIHCSSLWGKLTANDLTTLFSLTTHATYAIGKYTYTVLHLQYSLFFNWIILLSNSYVLQNHLHT